MEGSSPSGCHKVGNERDWFAARWLAVSAALVLEALLRHGVLELHGTRLVHGRLQGLELADGELEMVAELSRFGAVVTAEERRAWRLASANLSSAIAAQRKLLDRLLDDKAAALPLLVEFQVALALVDAGWQRIDEG